MRDLTERQQEVFDAIEAALRSTGRAPTLQELADAEGRSKITVLTTVRALERKGMIDRIPYVHRGITIRGKVCPTCGGSGHVAITKASPDDNTTGPGFS